MIPEVIIYDRPDVVEIEGEILAVTERAVLIDIDGYGEKWIPKSQIERGSSLDEGDLREYASLYISQWFARKEGIE